jgi:hypothetical protein
LPTFCVPFASMPFAYLFLLPYLTAPTCKQTAP